MPDKVQPDGLTIYQKMACRDLFDGAYASDEDQRFHYVHMMKMIAEQRKTTPISDVGEYLVPLLESVDYDVDKFYELTQLKSNNLFKTTIGLISKIRYKESGRGKEKE